MSAETKDGVRAGGVGDEKAREEVPGESGEAPRGAEGQSVGEKETGKKEGKTEWVTFQGISDIMRKALDKKS
jgi:hypothetical protein